MPITLYYINDMATFKFVLRPSTKTGRHPGNLSLRVVHGRKPKTASICCHLFAEEWDEVTQAILYPADDDARVMYLTGIHKKIAECADKVNEIIQKLNKKESYTAGDVIAYWRHKTNEGWLMGYATTLSVELIEKGQFRTAKAYGTVSRGLTAFNNGSDIPLDQINTTLIKAFEAQLKENGKQPNTISYYMRNLRAIYNKAVCAGRILKDEKPFSGVFTGVEETKKRALTSIEVNKFRDINFDELLKGYRPNSKQYRHLKSLNCAWRLFFFCLYAQGMCFVDMCYLKKSHLKDNVIRYYRKKTGKQIEVPVNEGMRTIIDSFKQEMGDSEYLFPPLAGAGDNLQQKYETALRMQNRRLKKLALLTGLEKNVATHVARHSWASILKNRMQPLSVISEGLGHSSEKMTRKYLASFDLSILVDAGNMMMAVVPPPSDTHTSSI